MTARRRAVTRVTQEVAHYLGNTPAVCRASYIDPRVIDLFESGTTIRPDLLRLGEDAVPGDALLEALLDNRREDR